MTQTTQRLLSDGDGAREALDYNRLPDPYREWAKIARNFVLQIEESWDKEYLMHNIIKRCIEVAELYRQQGRSLTKPGAIKVAQYTRLRFYRQKQRWKRVASVSLNSVIEDDNGYQTELSETIPDRKGIDLDEWLDFKIFYESRPERERKAIDKLVKEGTRTLGGYDWKLIRGFRKAYQK